MPHAPVAAVVALSALVALSACESKGTPPAAPAVSASALVAPPPPPGPTTLTFTVDPSSKTTIDMPAPKAKELAQVPAAHLGADDVKTVTATVKGEFFLHGHAVPKDAEVEVAFHYPSGQSATATPTRLDMERIKGDTTAAKGELSVDPKDVTKTTGQIKVDLTTLTTHTFDDAKKDGSQTEHAHNWLEVGNLVTPEVKEQNRWVIYTVKRVESPLVRTKAPLHVVLADHDVKPRDSFGKLAQGAFNLLGTKVAETADVTLDIAATPAAGAAATR